MTMRLFVLETRYILIINTYDYEEEIIKRTAFVRRICVGCFGSRKSKKD